MSGLDMMKKRMSFDGRNVNTQDARNVTSKWKSFNAALMNSYQGEWIEYNGETYRCLINPDKLKEDYDQKEISIDFNAGLQNGSVFYWTRTGRHWLVFLQELSEEAYFRASCRRCNYEIAVNDTNYWVYVKGPSQTNLSWLQKSDVDINNLNYILLMYITSNDETQAFFTRHRKIKFNNHSWNVAAVDRYTQDGIIEVYLEEDYDNPTEDLKAAAEEEIVTLANDAYIEGPASVKPYDRNITFSIVDAEDGEFIITSTKVMITEKNSASCKVNIITGKSGSFDVIYRTSDEDIILPVKIKSL